MFKEETKLADRPLPETLYGKWQADGEDGYLGTDGDPNTLVDQGETVRVAVYKLTGYAVVTNKTAVTPE